MYLSRNIIQKIDDLAPVFVDSPNVNYFQVLAAFDAYTAIIDCVHGYNFGCMYTVILSSNSVLQWYRQWLLKVTCTCSTTCT